MKSIATILMFISGLILLGWVARPLWDDIALLRDKTSNINNILATLSDTKNYQDDLIQKYNSITDEQLDRLLVQHLPKKSDTGTVLTALERIVTASDAKLNSVDFKKIEQQRPVSLVVSKSQTASQKSAQQNYHELSFTLNITSSYESFKAILRAFENNIRLIDVQNISFGASSKNTYTFTVSAKTYFRQ